MDLPPFTILPLSPSFVMVIERIGTSGPIRPKGPVPLSTAAERPSAATEATNAVRSTQVDESDLATLMQARDAAATAARPTEKGEQRADALDPVTIQKIRERIAEGFYESPSVLEAVALGMLRNADL